MKRRKNEIREELENLSPFLSDMKGNGDGFEIPKNYFKTLPNQVFEKLGSEPIPIAKLQKAKIGFWTNPFRFIFQPKPALAFATFLILAITGIFWINNNAESTSLADLTSEEIQTYISNNIDEFGEELFLDDDLGFEDFETTENSEMEDFMDTIIEDLDVEDLEEIL